MNNIDCEYLQTPLDIEAHHNIGGHTSSLYHYHNSYEIYLLLKGDVNYYIERSCYHFKRGDILSIRPDEMHRASCINNNFAYERLFINIQAPVLKMLSDDCTDLQDCFCKRPFGKDNLKHLNEGEIHELITLTHKINDISDSDAYGSSLLLHAYATEFLVIVNRAFTDASHEVHHSNVMTPLIADTMSYIEDHLAEDITLTLLSEHLYHNASYLSRTFREITGLTLQQYITSKRITLAKHYLSEQKSFLEASELCGFNNYSSFYRSFIKLVGVSPMQYIKDAKGHCLQQISDASVGTSDEQHVSALNTDRPKKYQVPLGGA